MISSDFVSLDDLIEEPIREIDRPYAPWDEDVMEDFYEQLIAMDVILVGRMACAVVSGLYRFLCSW